MSEDTAIFEGEQVRRKYDEQTETWYFSVVDIIQILTEQPDFQTARKYWNKLKERLKKEGSEAVTKCHQLKLTAEDGKKRLSSPQTTSEPTQPLAKVRKAPGLNRLGAFCLAVRLRNR